LISPNVYFLLNFGIVKRGIIILLTGIYLLSLVGIGINRFYCCGKLASVTLVYGAADNAKHSSARKYKCCKDIKQNLKVSHFNATSISLDGLAPVILPFPANFDGEKTLTYSTNQVVYQGNAPPGHFIVPAYTLHCTYRI
jgi:hypothetical protein